MKNNRRWGIYVVLGAVLAGGSVVRAEDAAPAAPPAAEAAPGQKAGRPNLAKRIQTDLALTDEQKEKAQPIFDDYATKSKALRDNAGIDRKQRREQRTALLDDLQKQLDPILTDEQKPKLAAIIEEAKTQRGGGGRGRGRGNQKA